MYKGHVSFFKINFYHYKNYLYKAIYAWKPYSISLCQKKLIFPIRLNIYNYPEILFILAHFPPIAKPCSFPPIVFVVVTKSKNTNTT